MTNTDQIFTTDKYFDKIEIDSETQAENQANTDSTETIATYL